MTSHASFQEEFIYLSRAARYPSRCPTHDVPFFKKVIVPSAFSYETLCAQVPSAVWSLRRQCFLQGAIKTCRGLWHSGTLSTSNQCFTAEIVTCVTRNLSPAELYTASTWDFVFWFSACRRKSCSAAASRLRFKAGPSLSVAPYHSSRLRQRRL